MTAVFLRHLDATDKELALRAGVHSGSTARYDIEPQCFSEVPTSPFAYWVSKAVRGLFDSRNQFEADGRIARQGLATSNDFRFIRAWFEVSPHSNAWRPITKGGRRSTYYRDVEAIVRWSEHGAEVKAYAEMTPGTQHWSRRVYNTDLYFQQGLSWPLRGIKFSSQIVPTGCIFSIAGKMAFVAPDDQLAFLGILNSEPFDRLMALFAGKIGGVQYEAGLIRRTPVPIITPGAHSTLSTLAKSAWLIRRSSDTVVEVSHAFTVPALLQVEGLSFGERAGAWAERVAAVKAELARVQAEVDDLCYELYGISEEDRRAIGMGLDVGTDADEDDDARNADADEDGGAVVELDPGGLAAGLVSWAVGVAVGRFDLRLATGERWAGEPDPFDPLPVCSPGMLTDADGLPPVTTLPEYTVEVSPVLVDDPGHRLDITFRVRSVFDALFGEEADRWWRDIGVALGAKGGEVGGWLGREFFDHHLKMYSKSRRKAPLLWPIGTKTRSYVIWLYAHQASPDSLFQILNDLVVPKLAVEERDLTQLRVDALADATVSQRKAIDSQERFVDELREFREELESVAPLWAPDLSDGIAIVLAPLWRLFAYHRAWSSELKKHWAKLAKGDYDWAQLAMHLWPERVVPKCAEDRSLAIAHGLEDVFWVEDQVGEDKWLPRQTPATPMDQLIAQRHSPATTAALQRMST